MFQRAGITNLETLSIEVLDVWDAIKLVGFASDPKSQAEYDAMPIPPRDDNSHAGLRLVRETVGWFKTLPNGERVKRSPLDMLTVRGFVPVRFKDTRTGNYIGFLGDTNRDATISGERALFKYLDGQSLVGWSARGDGNVSFTIAPGPNGFVILPVWGTSSDRDFIIGAIQGAVIVWSIGFAFAGAGSLAAQLGEKIVGAQFAATYPTISAAIGNAAIGTAMNGGDVEAAVKSAAITAGAGNIGATVGRQVTAATDLQTLGRVASAVTTAYIRGGDVDKAATFALVQSIPDFFPSEQKQMDWLSISSGNVGEPDVWGISAMPGVVSPESTLPGFSVASLPSLADNFTTADEGGLWDQTRNWFSTTFTRENIRAAQDLTAGAVGIIKTVRSLDPNAPQPRAAAQQTQTIRNPDGSVTRVAPDGTVQVISAEQLRQMQGGGAFNLSPQTLAIGGAALVALLLLARRR